MLSLVRIHADQGQVCRRACRDNGSMRTYPASPDAQRLDIFFDAPHYLSVSGFDVPQSLLAHLQALAYATLAPPAFLKLSSCKNRAQIE